MSASNPTPDAATRFDAITQRISELEHTMMIVYLYAGYSVRDAFNEIAGWGGSPLPTNLFGIAVEEMQHFHAINRLRRLAGFPPHFERSSLPARLEWYPFELELEPLSPKSTWKYTYVEAPSPEREKVLQALQAFGVDSKFDFKRTDVLYQELLDALEALGPERIEPDVKVLWRRKIARVRREGDHDHFVFFGALADGSHPVFTDRPFKAVWGQDKPAQALTRHLEWKANALATRLYWITCALLDASLRFDAWGFGPDEEYGDAEFEFHAIARVVMRRLLFPYGRELARRGDGFPFEVNDQRLPSSRPRFSSDRSKALTELLADTDEALALVARVARRSVETDWSVLRWLKVEFYRLGA